MTIEKQKELLEKFIKEVTRFKGAKVVFAKHIINEGDNLELTCTTIQEGEWITLKNYRQILDFKRGEYSIKNAESSFIDSITMELEVYRALKVFKD